MHLKSSKDGAHRLIELEEGSLDPRREDCQVEHLRIGSNTQEAVPHACDQVASTPRPSLLRKPCGLLCA